jgi:hypothetical protein
MSRVVRGCSGGGVDELCCFKLEAARHLVGQAVTCQASIKAVTTVEVNVRDAQWETCEWLELTCVQLHMSPISIYRRVLVGCATSWRPCISKQSWRAFGPLRGSVVQFLRSGLCTSLASKANYVSERDDIMVVSCKQARHR